MQTIDAKALVHHPTHPAHLPVREHPLSIVVLFYSVNTATCQATRLIQKLRCRTGESQHGKPLARRAKVGQAPRRRPGATRLRSKLRKKVFCCFPLPAAKTKDRGPARLDVATDTPRRSPKTPYCQISKAPAPRSASFKGRSITNVVISRPILDFPTASTAK